MPSYLADNGFQIRVHTRPDRIVGPRTVDWKYWPKDTLLPTAFQSVPNLEISNHPELEDQALLEWGMKKSDTSNGPRATVDVLYGCGTDLKWIHGIDDVELEKIVSYTSRRDPVLPDGKSQPSFRAFFINTPKSDLGWLPGNFSVKRSTILSLRKAGWSNAILSWMYSSNGYWAKMGNQCFLSHDDKERLSSFNHSYHYVCGWNTGGSFTQFTRTRHRHTYFCINYPSRALDRLKAYLQRDPRLAYRDFFLDALAAEDSLKEWQRSIGERREFLLKHEKQYEDKDINFADATKQLHRLARDWYALKKDCMDLHAQLGFVQKTYEKYMESLRDPKNGWKVDSAARTGESFEVLQSQCDHYTRWIDVYIERTNIQFNWLLDLTNQRESKIHTEIASSTAEVAKQTQQVAKQTQRDSASLITIAVVTMLFLPGTFISAILSTTFFDYDLDGLHVSNQWWILPAATLPLMVIVIIIWLGWWSMRVKKRVNN